MKEIDAAMDRIRSHFAVSEKHGVFIREQLALVAKAARREALLDAEAFLSRRAMEVYGGKTGRKQLDAKREFAMAAIDARAAALRRMAEEGT